MAENLQVGFSQKNHHFVHLGSSRFERQRDQILGIHIWVLERLHVHFFVTLADQQKKLQLHIFHGGLDRLSALYTLLSHFYHTSSLHVTCFFQFVHRFPRFPKPSFALGRNQLATGTWNWP